MSLSLNYLKTPSGLLKILEITLVVISFVIFRGVKTSFSLEHPDANYLGCGVLVTALIITPLLLTCYIMGRYEIQKTVFEMVFNFLMFACLLSAGAMAVDSFQNGYLIFISDDKKKKSLAMGSMCILASFAYLADTVFAVRLYRQVE